MAVVRENGKWSVDEWSMSERSVSNCSAGEFVVHRERIRILTQRLDKSAVQFGRSIGDLLLQIQIQRLLEQADQFVFEWLQRYASLFQLVVHADTEQSPQQNAVQMQNLGRIDTLS